MTREREGKQNIPEKLKRQTPDSKNEESIESTVVFNEPGRREREKGKHVGCECVPPEEKGREKQREG